MKFPASLYQSNAPGIGCAAAGSRNGIPQSRRDDVGRFKLEAGCDHAHHRNRKALACQIDAVGFDAQSFKRSAVNSNMTLASVAFDGEMCRRLRDRLQQQTLIGVDHGAAQVGAILRIERRIPALAAFGCNDGVCELELAHLQKSRSGPQPRAAAARQGRRQSPNRPPGMRAAATQGTPISVVISSNQVRRRPEATCRNCCSRFSATTPGLMPRRDRSAELTTAPPQTGRIAFDQFEQTMQRRGLARWPCRRTGAERKRRWKFALRRRPAHAHIRRQQDLASVAWTCRTMPGKRGIRPRASRFQRRQ